MDDDRHGSGQDPPLGASGLESHVNPPPPTPTWGEHIGSITMSQPQNSVNAPSDGGTVVIVTVNRSDGDTPATNTNAQHDDLIHRLPPRSVSNQDSENRPELSRTARADHKIYSDQLLTKERGYPLWVPGPGMQLPVEYRRRGTSIGDVGIITSAGEFDFLFNIFHTANHPVNRGLVPPGFSPLSLEELKYDIQKSIVYGPDTYLASSSVRKTGSNFWIGKVLFYPSEMAIGQRFESTATEAAILIMPDGATSQNLLNTWSVRQAIIRDARVWYRYARYTRGRNIKDGDIRIVVGFDKATSWGIATSTCNTGQTASFILKHDPTHLYRWDCIGGSGRVGPHRIEIEDLAEGNVIPQNQCVFVRTLNFTVSGEIWDGHPSEASQQLDQGSGRFDRPGSHSSNGGSMGGAGSSGAGSASGHQADSMPGSLHCKQSVNIDPVELGVANHPSAALHNCLHEKFPDANMVITEDLDWTSVLKDDDLVFPEPEDLCERILKSHELLYDQGIVQLVKTLRPSRSINLEKNEDTDVLKGASSDTRDSSIGKSQQSDLKANENREERDREDASEPSSGTVRPLKDLENRVTPLQNANEARIMAPTILDNVKGSSKPADHVPATSSSSTTAEPATSGTSPDDKAKLTSADIMGLEDKYGAHNYHPLPIVFDRALGAKVWDPEGREYIDMLSAYSATNQGHCHPKIISALVEQAQKLTLSSPAFYNSVFGRFAQQITALFGYDMVLSMNTDAEAVETSLKLARKWACKRKGIEEGRAIILSVEGNFYGRTLGIISMSTDPDSRGHFGPYLEGVGPTFINEEGESTMIRFGVLEDLERALAIHGENVAAFLVEPIQDEAGILVPPQGYLKGVQELCKKYNVLLICDETQTGLCRTGKMLASEYEGVRPDVVLLGKALSGGVYPLSVVLADKDVMLCIQPNEYWSTYGGNPVGCAVAMTALNVLIEEKLAERAFRLGEYFRSAVRVLNSPLVKEVRGRGLLNAIVMDEKKSVKGRPAWQFCLLLSSRGLLAKPIHVNVIRFAPPLVISEEDLAEAVKIIGECLLDLDVLDQIPGAPLTTGQHSSVASSGTLVSLPPRHHPIDTTSTSPFPAKSMHLERTNISVIGIPSVTIQDRRLVVGTSKTSSVRSYTPVKVLGEGYFATVLLCDWHGTLPPNTPLSPMQRGAGARPDWAGMRLVAIKRMKKKWAGGWDECQKLKELQALRAIPCHPSIIPLYDFFLLPDTKELYFVFESMEGNLYHLIKARKGRPLAGGLVSHIFAQIVEGLHHIHACGYFHRDMKPENVLVTTTGLFDYTSVSPIAKNAPKTKDVVAIIKLADFGLARETKSSPPYTDYVSNRWYRAPEVLLSSRDYSNPIDMWAFGTIMAELVNLRPLFPGSDQINQVARILEVLGDPSDEYGLDAMGSILGGGTWVKGVKLAKSIGFQFPKTPPKDFYSLFADTVPRSLVHCIRDLLRYDPDRRLTSQQCRNHSYLRETLPLNRIILPFPPAS